MGIYTRDEIHEFAHELIAAMQTPQFAERALLKYKAMKPTSETQVMDTYESAQVDYLTEKGKDGAEVMRQLVLAVKRYKDKRTEDLIAQLCMLQSDQMRIVGTRYMNETMGAGGAAAGGAGGGAGAGAGAHGHSHNGVPCHGHGQTGPFAQQQAAMMQQMMSNPQQMAMMNMAVQSMSDSMRADMTRIQSKMMQGQPPVEEDRQKMMNIQRHIQAFMSTMGMFNSAPASS